ncbi:MAG: hypothetical protein WAU07_03670, partial [Microgenomates group bacterium]
MKSACAGSNTDSTPSTSFIFTCGAYFFKTDSPATFCPTSFRDAGADDLPCTPSALVTLCSS